MMKLSTAILKGSKGRNQTDGSLLDRDGSVCALGAACYGVGIEPRVGSEFNQQLRNRFPILTYVIADGINLENLIWNKNDRKCWGFKHIARWLRSFGY